MKEARREVLKTVMNESVVEEDVWVGSKVQSGSLKWERETFRRNKT